MNTSRILYFSFLLTSLLFAIYCKKQEKGLAIFPVLLTLSMISEIAAQILSFYKINFFIIYHFYIPIEYILWTFYFYKINDKKIIKKILLYSVPLFMILSLLISFSIVRTDKYPNIQLNIEGILLITISIYTIFTIEISENAGIFSRPVFWICVAVLIYYTSISSLIAMYNFISESNAHLINTLRLYLLRIPNYILYTCLSIAFICSNRIKK